jgi:hypothetical protein
MNNTFNTRRFGLLLRKTILERPVQMMGFTAMSYALSFIIYIVAKSFMFIGAAQSLAFIWGLLLGSSFLASFVFGYFSTNASGSSYLTLPASHLEKWLCGVLIAGVLYPILFLVFFRLMDAAFVSIYHHGLDPDSPFYKRDYDAVYLFDYTGHIARDVYRLFLLMTGTALVGSLYFNKLPFIKVMLGICLLCLGVMGLNIVIAKLMFGNVADAAPFSHVTLTVGKEEASIDLPERVGQVFQFSLWYILPAVLWLLSFTRLKEKQF